MCIYSPNCLRRFSTSVVVLIASSRVGKINALSSAYSDIQWDISVPFVRTFCPVILPLGFPFAVSRKYRYVGDDLFVLSSVCSSDSIAAWNTRMNRRGARLSP